MSTDFLQPLIWIAGILLITNEIRRASRMGNRSVASMFTAMLLVVVLGGFIMLTLRDKSGGSVESSQLPFAITLVVGIIATATATVRARRLGNSVAFRQMGLMLGIGVLIAIVWAVDLL